MTWLRLEGTQRALKLTNSHLNLLQSTTTVLEKKLQLAPTTLAQTTRQTTKNTSRHNVSPCPKKEHFHPATVNLRSLPSK